VSAPFDAAAISAELVRIAALEPRSLPARIDSKHLDAVIVLVMQNVTAGIDDIEVAVLAAVAKTHNSHRDLFLQNRKRKRTSPWQMPG